MPNQFGHKDYEIVKREILYEGKFRLVRLHIRIRLFNGGWSQVFTREVFERPPAVAVLPYDPILDRVILIEQFRPGALADPTSPWLIEIPAGVIEYNEKPADVAIREAKEETGCDVQRLELVQDYFVSPGGASEYIYVYIGIIDAKDVNGIHGLENEHEDIRVLNISMEEACEKMRKHEIKHSPAIITLQWIMLNQI